MGNTIVTKEDDGYKYRRVEARRCGEDIIFRLSKTHRESPVKERFYCVKGFFRFSASDVISNLFEHSDGSNPYPLGRHFEDALRVTFGVFGMRQTSVLGQQDPALFCPTFEAVTAATKNDWDRAIEDGEKTTITFEKCE